jgi:type II secretory pathway component PulC
MGDILVTMNQVDLTRPAVISFVNATSEGYTFAMSILCNTKRVLIHKFVITHYT